MMRPQVVFQSYLRSNSDVPDDDFPEVRTSSFNPTLGLILTENVSSRLALHNPFQSYLRSNSDDRADDLL